MATTRAKVKRTPRRRPPELAPGSIRLMVTVASGQVFGAKADIPASPAGLPGRETLKRRVSRRKKYCPTRGIALAHHHGGLAAEECRPGVHNADHGPLPAVP
jgi:hypothetical protein